MGNVEVLAPAGSLETLYASLKFADAVYVGTNKFGARAYADNPSVDKLAQAISYAHLFGKKIYLTVNTLLTDDELKNELYYVIKPLYEVGLDACIVQDLGVLKFLHQNFPDMDLHASTQMTILSGTEAQMLKSYGVTRFVPARELSILDIKRIREQTDLEIETFVHGALCYCYSGQCLMSEVIGNRSGNHGKCAGPCRLEFSGDFTKSRDYYRILNTKDSCTLMFIPEMLEAKIDSFKIEGRMKNKEYAAFIAYLYRKYCDFYFENGKEAFDNLRNDKDSALYSDYDKAMDLYNRGGFTNSFLFEKDKFNFIFKNHSGHYGVPVGTVIDFDKRSVKIKLDKPIRYKDVLEIRNKKLEKVYDYTVKNDAKENETITSNILKGSKVAKGQKVFRTRNGKLYDSIDELIEATEMKIGVVAYFEAKGSKEIMFKLSTSDGNSVVVYGECAQIAQNKPVYEEAVLKPLSQFGNTNFSLEDISVNIDNNLFFPISSLKKLRREAVNELEKKLLEKHTRQAKPLEFCDYKIKESYKKNIISVSSLSQLVTVDKYAKSETIIHIKLENFSKKELEEAFLITENRKNILISFPRILKGDYHFNDIVFGNNICGVIVNSLRSIKLAKELFDNPVLILESNMYTENTYAKKAYEDFGCVQGPEIVYQRIPVMVSEHCVNANHNENGGKCYKQTLLNISTKKGDDFIVANHCNYCYNTIYTKKLVIKSGEFEFVRVEFLTESEKEIKEVILKWSL